MSLSASLVSSAMTLLPATRCGRLLTLIFHRVRPERDPMFPGEVTAAEFDWMMALVARHCRPLTMREAVSRLRAGTLPARAVAITFDDGYRDNAEVALPLLQKNGVPATFFVATSFLNGGLMWNDAVIEALRGTGLRTLDLPALDISALPLDGNVARGRAAERVIQRIKHLSQDERSRKVELLVAACGVSLPSDLMMTNHQVRELHRAGMEVGAHTRTHPILSTLDAEVARLEISGSREELAQMIGAPVTAFAYPNGRPGEDYGPRERQLVESLGFDYAVATRWGVSATSTDCYQLPRFTPWDRTPARWLARVLLQYRQVVV